MNEELANVMFIEKSIKKRTIDKKSIIQSFYSFDISRDIISKSIEILKHMNTDIIKKSKRDHLIFFCLYYAYIECGYIVMPIQIAYLHGFDIKIVNKSLGMFYEINTNYKIPIIDFNINKLIDIFSDNLGLSNKLKMKINYLCEKFLLWLDDKKFNNIQNILPQKIAGGLILHITEKKKLNIDDFNTEKIFGVIKTTMFAYKKKLDKILIQFYKDNQNVYSAIFRDLS